MNQHAIVSSGDAEKDRQLLARFAQNNERIQAGCCPNGCGGMVEVDTHNAECPKCGFGYFSSGGLNFKNIAGRA